MKPIPIPKQTLLQYWGAYADLVLPFLKDREITIEQVFENFVVYRRHPKKDSPDFIYVENRDDILHWANQHVYSFHPYICPLHKEGRCYFVLDIDPKGANIEFSTTKKVALEVANALSLMGLKFLLKFCGKNGFHFIWAWDAGNKPNEEKIFKINKDIILKLIRNIHSKIYRIVNIDSSDSEQHQFLYKEYPPSPQLPTLIFDAKILHHHGNIRSPFSIHPESGLVSVPLKPESILKFSRQEASPESLIPKKEDFSWVELPTNRL